MGRKIERILIDPGIYNCLNMGGVAMFQVAIGRLRALWPSATIHALTDDPEALAFQCPGVLPVPHADLKAWFSDRFFLGRVHNYLPPSMSERLAGAKWKAHHYKPTLIDSLIRLKQLASGRGNVQFNKFAQAVYDADLLIISGSSGPGDMFPAYTKGVCGLLEMAASQNIPIAMLSQAIGPLRDRQLTARLKSALPRVGLITLREKQTAPSLLRSLGVKEDRLMVTGDDAIEMAYEAAPEKIGGGVGVNLRFGIFTSIEATALEKIKPVVHAFAKSNRAPLVPVPIGLHSVAGDCEAIASLTSDYEGDVLDGEIIDTPRKVIEQAGRCRIVLAAAYHAAVFALSQGVPAVCLAQNEYYRIKFGGLAAQFGSGCRIVDTSRPDFPEQLAEALEESWNSSDSVRVPLRQSAARQIELSKRSYERFYESLTATRVLASIWRQSAATTRAE